MHLLLVLIFSWNLLTIPEMQNLTKLLPQGVKGQEEVATCVFTIKDKKWLWCQYFPTMALPPFMVTVLIGSCAVSAIGRTTQNMEVNNPESDPKKVKVQEIWLGIRCIISFVKICPLCLCMTGHYYLTFIVLHIVNIPLQTLQMTLCPSWSLINANNFCSVVLLCSKASPYIQ